ncbi:MAG: hypothetical protein AB7O96_13835 [Pseudobdellovibrionaceae bacterium]
MRRLLLILLCGLVTACPSSKKSENKQTAPVLTKEALVGVWKEELSVCNGTTYQSTGMINRLTFNTDGTYNVQNVGTGCTAKREGTFTVTGITLALSNSTVSCSINPCNATYQVNSVSKTLNCPSGIITVAQNFSASVDATTLYLTPQTGPDAVCYYKYTKQ